MEIIKKTVDYLGQSIQGQIYDSRNIELLQWDLKREMQFNDPRVCYEPILRTYKENKDRYGTYLYESEKNLEFIDVDVFRQAALTFKSTGQYSPFDRKFDKAAYKRYWDTQLYRRRNGMTAYAGINTETGEKRLVYISGHFYNFLNFSPITRRIDDDNSVSNESDFENVNDEALAEYKLEDLIKELNVRDTRTAKKAVDFPDFIDGQYHYDTHKNTSILLGLNCYQGKARRKGMSYYHGSRSNNIIDLNANATVILVAYDKKYLIHGKGLMKMVYTFSDFLNKFTAFKKRRLVNNKEHLKLGYKNDDGPEEHGLLSEVLAVSALNNADVTIGKDIYELSFEEMGKFPNWAEVNNVTTSAAEAGDYKTGHLGGWGTGGTDEANWTDFEKVCYTPKNYGAIECNNIWDSGKEGTASIYFYPHVQGLEGHIDYNGNTNYETAWKSYLAKKEEKRANTTDEVDFEKWCGQRANCPQEAFAKSSTNIFPREIIRARLDYIERTPEAKYLARCGQLVSENGRIWLKTNEEIRLTGGTPHPPVNEFPLKKDTDVHGCFVEWIPPYRDPKTGIIPEGLYVAMQDPYAHDKDIKKLNLRDSLGATYWYENINKFTPYGGGIPVAAYVGRPSFVRDYNEQMLLGLQYYHSKLMFENDRGDVKAFMEAKKLLSMLYEEPEFQFDKEISGKTGRGFGTHLTDKKKAKAAIYLRDFLRETLSVSSDGVSKTFIDYVNDPGLLKELLRWDMQGNFDRVSAWLVGMFIIKELEHKELEPPKAVDQNSFFNRKHF